MCPVGAGKTATCELYSLRYDIWDKQFSSLYTYWEPDNPNQLHFLSLLDSMDPGAGYWIQTAFEGLFVPPTACS